MTRRLAASCIETPAPPERALGPMRADSPEPAYNNAGRNHCSPEARVSIRLAAKRRATRPPLKLELTIFSTYV